MVPNATNCWNWKIIKSLWKKQIKKIIKKLLNFKNRLNKAKKNKIKMT